MQVRRFVLRFSRADSSEVLFDAAAAGLRNGSMRTWRAALAVIGRRLQAAFLDPGAVGHLVSNAQALEEIAHRQGSEDCKVRLCSALGVVGSGRMSDESGEVLGKGISSIAERRLGEHRPVLSAINALEQMAATNGVAAVRTAGWLGQHLASLPPPAAVYGFDGEGLEHPTRALFALLVELARQADKQSDARLNDALIDACSMIARKLPGAQDRETIDVLVSAVGDAGVAAARRYGAGADWHGTHDASATLLRLHKSIQDLDDEGAKSAAEWVAEVIGRMGCWVVANPTPLSFRTWNSRSDMAVWLAEDLLQIPHESIGKAFVELVVRQHNSDIPMENRDAFIGLCQRMSGELLGLARVLDDADESGDRA
jgi:hypothetical protein